MSAQKLDSLVCVKPQNGVPCKDIFTSNSGGTLHASELSNIYQLLLRKVKSIEIEYSYSGSRRPTGYSIDYNPLEDFGIIGNVASVWDGFTCEEPPQSTMEDFCCNEVPVDYVEEGDPGVPGLCYYFFYGVTDFNCGNFEIVWDGDQTTFSFNYDFYRKWEGEDLASTVGFLSSTSCRLITFGQEINRDQYVSTVDVVTAIGTYPFDVFNLGLFVIKVGSYDALFSMFTESGKLSGDVCSGFQVYGNFGAYGFREGCVSGSPVEQPSCCDRLCCEDGYLNVGVTSKIEFNSADGFKDAYSSSPDYTAEGVEFILDPDGANYRMWIPTMAFMDASLEDAKITVKFF